MKNIKKRWETIDISLYGWVDFFNWWNVNFQRFRVALGFKAEIFSNIFRFDENPERYNKKN
jgi:hypothetical protein